MTRLAALHARITGDASGFVKAATAAEAAANRAAPVIGGGAGGKPGPGFGGAAASAKQAINKLTSAPGMRMLPVQLSQVAQQAAAGTSVMRALTIQAADIGLAFGTAGAIVGTLATVAMPILIGAFSATKDGAEDLDKALEGFEARLNSVKGAMELAQTPMDELREKYGTLAEQIQRTSQIAAQAALAEAFREFNRVAGEMTYALGDVSGAIAKYNREVAKANEIQKVLGERTLMNAAAWDEAEAAVERARKAVEDAAGELGLTAGQVDVLQAALNKMGEAKGPKELAEAAGEALEQIQSLFPASTVIPPEVAQIVEQLRMVQTEGAAATAVFEDMRIAAAGVVIGGEGGQGTSTYGGGRGGDPRDFTNMDEFREQLDPEDEEKGRRGGLRSAEQFERDLERLQDQLATEIELERQMNEERQAMLNEALNKELLTRAEYDELMERESKRHADTMTDIAQKELDNKYAMTQSILGGLASLMSSENKRLFQIGKMAGIANAIVDTHRGISRALAEHPAPYSFAVAAAVAAKGFASIAAIRSQQFGGGGGGGNRGGGGGVGAAAGGAGAIVGGNTEGSNRRQINLTLIGEQGFSRAQIVQIAEALNDSGDEGQELIQIRGRR